MYSLRHLKVSKGVKVSCIIVITNITPAPWPYLYVHTNNLSYWEKKKPGVNDITRSSVTDFIILSTARCKVSFNANISFEQLPNVSSR